MHTPANDALLDQISRTEFDALVNLYDRFAHAKDPFDSAADKAESTFNETIQIWFDILMQGKCPFQDFRRAIIKRCKQRIINEVMRPPN